MLIAADIVVLLLGIHVDDLARVSVESHLEWLCAALLCEFEMEGIGCPTCVLGTDIDLRSDGSIQCGSMVISRILTKQLLPTAPLSSPTLHLIKLCVGFIFGLVSLADGCLQHINFLNVPLPDATPVYMHAPKGYGRP